MPLGEFSTTSPEKLALVNTGGLSPSSVMVMYTDTDAVLGGDPKSEA